MKFGLSGFPLGQMLSTVNVSPRDAVLTIARAADEAGFDFVCAQDHILAPREWAGERGGETWFDPFSVLAMAAGVTERIKLVTDVLVFPYRTPFHVAKMLGSLDQLSNGRVIAGVAAGYLEREFQILGAEFERRGDWTDDAIEVLKQLWSNDWTDVDSEFFKAKDIAISPRPVQKPHPRIWIGGNSMRALRRAVEHAQGWTPFRGSPETIPSMLERFEIPADFDVCVPLRHGVYTEDKGSIDADSCTRQAEAFAAVGVTHMKVGFRGPTPDGYLRALNDFAETVMA